MMTRRWSNNGVYSAFRLWEESSSEVTSSSSNGFTVAALSSEMNGLSPVASLDSPVYGGVEHSDLWLNTSSANESPSSTSLNHYPPHHHHHHQSGSAHPNPHHPHHPHHHLYHHPQHQQMASAAAAAAAAAAVIRSNYNQRHSAAVGTMFAMDAAALGTSINGGGELVLGGSSNPASQHLLQHHRNSSLHMNSASLQALQRNHVARSESTNSTSSGGKHSAGIGGV